VDKAPDAFRTISEVAEELDVPQHVLRFWETRFPQIRPMKRAGGRRYYRPDDVALVRGIRHLLYGEGYTIRGVQRILRDQGARFVQTVWQAGAEVQIPDEGDAASAEAPAEGLIPVVREGRGLLPWLSSRSGVEPDDDSGDRRHEPPLESAPIPRVDLTDRIGEAPAAAMRPADIGGLRVALEALVECRRRLDAVFDERV
jgi:DNA-binding transcriptional MerR regulator